MDNSWHAPFGNGCDEPYIFAPRNEVLDEEQIDREPGERGHEFS